MHSVVIINSGKAPTSSIDLRKTIMHGVNKAYIIRKELSGMGTAVDKLFPTSAPYSNVELTPRWDYDFEKAAMLNCAPASSTVDECMPHTLDFVMLEGESLHAAIEGEIEQELAVLGITVNKRIVPKDELNAAMTSGDFHMVFSETWGAPYDPVSYITGWMANDEAHYSAMAGLTGYNSRENTFAKIDLALDESDPTKREELWHEIH